ncbi:MAG: hypothetical protein ACU85E_02940 [Gammaproteobacteria bacterium]
MFKLKSAARQLRDFTFFEALTVMLERDIGDPMTEAAGTSLVFRIRYEKKDWPAEVESKGSRRQSGVTLLELAIVLLVLVALAGLAIPYFSGTSRYAQCTATEASMVAIRDAIIGSYERPGYLADVGALPGTLGDLLVNPGVAIFNPETQRGWRGPYVNSGMNDAFRFNPFVLQIPSVDADGNDCSDMGLVNPNQCARLVALGPNGQLDLVSADANASARNDDRVLYLFIPDPNPGLSRPCNENL